VTSCSARIPSPALDCADDMCLLAEMLDLLIPILEVTANESPGQLAENNGPSYWQQQH